MEFSPVSVIVAYYLSLTVLSLLGQIVCVVFAWKIGRKIGRNTFAFLFLVASSLSTVMILRSLPLYINHTLDDLFLQFATIDNLIFAALQPLVVWLVAWALALAYRDVARR